MSRIGKVPIAIPSGVEVKIDGTSVSVTGPRGEIIQTFAPSLTIQREDGFVHVQRPNDEPMQRALHGLTRTLLNNMVIGVSQGFDRVLELVGTGYRAEQQGGNLTLQLGFSHSVTVEPLGDNELVAESQTRIIVRGVNKQVVGEQAARIRKLRKPNPYTGKGVKYQGEVIRRKAGKAAAGAGV
jgi:large subunit ribosomal protein L6